ncbi:MAG: GDSL-type esterase/lipase family protein [Nitrospirota bacterium]|nr:GDSL-type esterase/lipase family protein [Nitrospirota bacterium]
MNKKDILFIGHSLIEFFNWQGRFPDHAVANLGVAGETVEGLLSRVDGIIDEYPHPDLVFIMTGTNDVAMEDFDFMSGYRDIIEKLSDAYPESGIFIFSIPPIMLEWITDTDILQVNRAIERLTRETGAGFLDIYRLFVDTEGNAVTDYFLDDGVHLSVHGYSVWTKSLEAIINQ